jgi:PKD repeat protein
MAFSLRSSVLFLIVVLGSFLPAHVFGQCNANFNILPNDTVCGGTSVSLVADADTSQVSSYNWSVGGSGKTTTTFFPRSNLDASFTVGLTVIDNFGVSCSQIKSVFVLRAPIIAIAVDSSFKCIPGSKDTTFRPTFTIDTSQTPLSLGPFTWIFSGPGLADTVVSGAISQQPTFLGFGTYSVQVFAAGASCSGYSISLPFYTDPVAVPGIAGNPTICEGDSITVYNQSTPAFGNCYTWDWGNYGPRYDTCTRDSQTWVFDLQGVDLCNSNNLPFQGIDDGITLIARNECQLTHRTITQITIRAKPQANFNTWIGACMPDPTVTFQNGTCPGPGQSYIDPTRFLWIFGDGDSSTLANPSHTYPGPGTYTVTLVATNSCGTSSMQGTVVVYDFPNARAIPDTTVLCAPDTLSFRNLSTPDSGVFYTWSIDPPRCVSFINGTDSASEEPFLLFACHDTFVVTLKDSNICGVDVWDTTIFVNNIPTALLDPLPDTCGAALYTPGGLFRANGAAIDSIVWTYSGGSMGRFVGANPTPFLFQGGTNVITLEAANVCGVRTVVDSFIIDTVRALSPGNDTTICVLANGLQLNGNPKPGFWTPWDTASYAYVDSAGLFLPRASGTYPNIYQYLDTYCTVRDTLYVTVVDTPTVIPRFQDTAVCIGSPQVCLEAQPLPGSWSGALNGSSCFDPDSVGVFRFDYLHVDTVSNCPGRTFSRITVNELPSVFAGNDTSYCYINANLPLPRPNPLGGMWSGLGVANPTQGLYNPALLPSIPPAGYTDTLIYTFVDTNSCENFDTLLVTVFTLVNAVAGPGDTACFNGPPTALTGAFPPGGRWNGPGVDPAMGVFTPVLMQVGQNPMEYVIAEGTSCEDRDTTSVFINDTTRINPGPDLIICPTDSPFQLTNYSPAANCWLGQGIAGCNTFVPDSVGAGNFSILALRDTTAQGCISQGFRRVDVDVPPSSSFTNQAQGCVNAPISFTNQSGGAVLYFWKFGDGNTSTQRNPTHAYLDTGTYLICLIVTNRNGCQDTSYGNIFISEPPRAGFVMDVDSGCAPLAVTFTDTSLVAGASYQWQFGNFQTSSSAMPGTVVFNQGKNDTLYNVRLTLTNFCGVSVEEKPVFVRPQPQVEFGFNVNNACSPAEICFLSRTAGKPDSLFWDFGNGAFSNDSIPPCQFFVFNSGSGQPDTLYDVTLSSTNACGADTLTRQVRILRNDVNAFFNLDTTRGCAPLRVQVTDFSFQPNVSYDINGSNRTNQNNFSFTFTQPGQYTIRQFADNTCGFDTFSQVVTVLTQQAADFQSNAPVCLHDTMRFAPRDTSGITGYLWDFGDGTTSTAIRPGHVYAQPDTYRVSLTTFADSSLCENSWDTLVIVRPLPSAAFAAAPTAGCPPLSVEVISSPVGLTYAWDFGDPFSPQTSNQRFPGPHVYDSTGTYRLRLRTTDQFLCSSDSSLSILVYERPRAAFDVSADTLCGAGTPFQFTDRSVGNQLSHRWDFGDPQILEDTSLLTNPSYGYLRPGSFQVNKVTANNFGCADTVSRSLRVLPQPVADFALSSNQLCVPEDLLLTQQSTGFSRASWDFGDGSQFSTASQPAPHRYVDPDTQFTIILRIDTAGFCFDSTSRTVATASYPMAAYSPSVDSVCDAPARIDFTNQSTTQLRPLSYAWNFGEMGSSTNTSSMLSPFHVYQSSGTFPVKLLVTNSFGCADSVEQPIWVFPQPVASFGVSDQQICVPDTVFFTQTSSNFSKAQWNFGNGSSQQLQPPGVRYTSPDVNFRVQLVVDTAGFCFDTVSQVVETASYPIAAFAPATDSICDAPANIAFSNGSITALRPISYAWDFGDPGTNQDVSAGLNPSYTYPLPAVYQPKLVVTNSFGCADSVEQPIWVFPQPVASFGVSDQQICVPDTVFFTQTSTDFSKVQWNFGNGSSQQLQPPGIRYTSPDVSFRVQLVVDTAGFCFDTVSQVVETASYPIAAFAPATDSICDAPATIAFSNGSITALRPISYAWDFGDPGTNQDVSAGLNPSYTYPLPAVYQPKLVVTNSFGCADSVEQPIWVFPQPLASFGVSDQQICVPDTVFFTQTSSNFSKAQWNFGNGSSQQIQPAGVRYTSPDVSFTVQLVVDTAGFCFDTVSQVVETASYPIAAFSPATDSICDAPATIAFSNGSLTALRPISYAWDFGDPGTNQDVSAGLNPSYTYPLPAVYQPKLVVINSFGCADSVEQPIWVFPQPLAAFSLSRDKICVPDTIRVGNLSANYAGSQWDWGEFPAALPSLQNQPDPYAYTTADDTFRIRLVVDTADFCFDTTFAQIQTSSYPVAAFEAIPDSLCGTPVQVSLQNASQTQLRPIVSHGWDFGNGEMATTANPTATFDSAAVYEVSLRVENSFGCADSTGRRVWVFPQPEASFTADTLTGCDPLEVVFSNRSTGYSKVLWDWDDASPRSRRDGSVRHTFFQPDRSYQVQLVVDTASFCFDTATLEIQVASWPVAAFTPSLFEHCGPTAVSFSNQSLSAQLPLSYQWDFGNGTNLNTAFEPSTRYENAGLYRVQLVASNPFSCRDTAYQSLEIYPQPMALFEADPTDGCHALTVNFFNLTTDSTYTQQRWSFGDGNLSTLDDPIHRYVRPGTYDVSLWVSYEDKCEDELNVASYVNVRQTPLASFDWYPVPDTVTGENTGFIQFENRSENADFYRWEFGDPDGSTSGEENPIFQYPYNDSFTVRLTAIGSNGCEDDTLIRVHPEPFGFLYVPNAFAPLSGVRDANRFLPKGIGLIEYHIAVYDLFGNEVWASKELTFDGRPAEGWDGRINGRLVNTDAFVWKVHTATFEGNRDFNGRRKGTVTLIR